MTLGAVVARVGVVALVLAGAAAAAASGPAPVQHLQAVARDLQERVAAGQVSATRACEVMRDTASNPLADGEWQWHPTWHRRPDARYGSDRLWVDLALACPTQGHLLLTREARPRPWQAVRIRVAHGVGSPLSPASSAPSSSRSEAVQRWSAILPTVAAVGFSLAIFALLGVVAAARRARDRNDIGPKFGGLHVPDLPALDPTLIALQQERAALRAQLHAAGVALPSDGHPSAAH